MSTLPSFCNVIVISQDKKALKQTHNKSWILGLVLPPRTIIKLNTATFWTRLRMRIFCHTLPRSE